MSEALDKIRDARRSKGKVTGNFDACSFANDYPLIFAVLHDEGKGAYGKITGSLIVVIEDGLWKAILNDRSDGEVAFVTATTFATLLDSVESGLGEGTLDWRGSRNAGSRNRQPR